VGGAEKEAPVFKVGLKFGFKTELRKMGVGLFEKRKGLAAAEETAEGLREGG